MRIRSTLGALLVAILAALALASPASAKGGTTTTTPGCAVINDWRTTLDTVDGQSVVTLHVGVFNGCVDEGAGAGKSPAMSMNYYDTATGAWQGASVTFANYGQNNATYNLGSPDGPTGAVTLVFNVTRANGKLQDSRTATIAELKAPYQTAA